MAVNVGEPTYATDVNSLLPQVIVKPTATARQSTATVAIDPDLQVALGVGTYLVRMQLFFTITTTATAGFKTQWGMSSGALTAIVRGCNGPFTSGAGPQAQTTTTYAAAASNADSVYRVAAGGTFATVREEAYNVVVTSAGTFGLYWAQEVSTAVNTTLQGGSTMYIQQIG